MRAFIREVVGTILLATVIFVVLQISFQTFIVVGCSMEPNFQWTQRLVVNKAVYHFREPERGNVIVFEPADGRQADYIKRVIALPGETVEIKDGLVYVDGSPLDESYIKEPPRYTLQPREVPEDNYFVLGDNRNNSNDSHNGWTVPRENIIGRVWLSIWPPSQWGVPDNHPLPEPLVSPAE
jgi:signal peptidase I